MKLLRGLSHQSSDSALAKGCVATIGNFDGVHLGHQSIVKHVLEKAHSMNLPSVIIVFEPQPLEFFAPEKAPARIMRFREKYLYLESLGVDFLLCLPFSQTLASLSPQSFVEQVIAGSLSVKYLIIGDDFSFGKERQGNYALLETLGKTLSFSVQDTKSVCLANERVSSTMIRNCLADSQFEKAEGLLGRPFEFTGKVCYGQQLGRQLGVPTINLLVSRKRSPVKGVFVSEVQIDGDQTIYQSISNLGTRPTVNGQGTLLEVHLFNFNQMIYGKKVRVRPLMKVRDEKKFNSIEIMTEQIFADIAIAKQYFENRST